MSQIPIREERKVVTALFADVVGSTALAERLDPEDAREIVGEAVSRIVQAAEALGGTVKDLAGDGALILFGAPLAHEDDPERAVRAGLEIVRRIGAYRSEVAPMAIEGFGVRVGIETGLVVLGPVGAGSRVEYGATGDAVNTAARLQSHADPGTVLVGEATRRAIEPLFDWSEPRVLTLKGKEKPVRAWAVLAPRAVPGRLRGLGGADVALVGRDRELGSLRSAAGELRSGRGGILLVTGEAGVGKSRLLRELRISVEPAARWLEGRCASYAGTVPYWPFREVLYQWLGPSPARRPATLERKLAEALEDGEAAVPFLEALLGVEPVAERATALAGLSAESLQRGIAEAMKGLLVQLARRGPLAVVLEDLHWADPTSIQLLHRLLPVAEDGPVLFALTSRVEEGRPSEELLGGASAVSTVREVRLDALAEGDDRQLLVTLVGEGTLPAAVERRLLEQSAGNPFYLEELVRALMDSGALRRETRGWRFEGMVALDIPDTVEKVVLTRLDRLPADSRDVVDAASVVGPSFDVALVEVLVGGNERVRAIVDDLVALDLVRRESPGPASEYLFKHVLIQEAAYRSILKRRRRELHLRAAEALETRFADRLEGQAALLGRHYRAAGRLDRALELLHHGARQARKSYAVEEALHGYSEALEVAEQLGATGRRLAELRLERGEVLARSGEIAGAGSDLEASVREATEAGDRVTRMRALDELGFLLAGAADYRKAVPPLESALRIAEELSDRSEQVRILSRLSIVFTNQLQLDRAIHRAGQALELARRVGDRRATATAMDALEVAAVMVGDFGMVDEIGPALAAIHRESGDLWYLQFAIFQWVWPLIAAGRWDDAFARMDEARAVNRRIRDRGNEPMYLATLSWIHRSRGDYGSALEAGRRAVDIAAQVQHAEWTSWSEGILGWVLLELLAVSEAATDLAGGLEAAQEAGARIQELRCAAHLAHAHLLAGDHAQASTLADRAERLLDAVTAPPGRAYLQGADANIAVARVRMAAGQVEHAERLVGPVLEAAEAAGWHELIGSASVVIGRCRLAVGDLEGARSALARAASAARAGLPRVALESHGALVSLSKALGRRDDAQRHRAEAMALVKRLSAGIEDESIRHGFVTAALRALEEERL